ncbi:hypothetical protein F383_33860 [Gossypium arboreum]|uniref:Uncharacterized protein n=1 Tax=Gossypium arboreum TaxID=29729 RepID=A0A0B0N1F7_GOSAR|nr:hypothetical protein F383_33860 [Gossypium arboreum]
MVYGMYRLVLSWYVLNYDLSHEIWLVNGNVYGHLN